MQALAKRLFLAGRFRLPSGFAARGPAAWLSVAKKSEASENEETSGGEVELRTVNCYVI